LNKIKTFKDKVEKQEKDFAKANTLLSNLEEELTMLEEQEDQIEEKDE